MSFLTPPRNSPVAGGGVGGLLSMKELTSLKNFRGPVPALNHVAQMLALPQARANSRAVPLRDFPPIDHVAQMLALPQARANSRAVPLREFPPGEILPASRMIAAGQAFGLPGLGNGRGRGVRVACAEEYTAKMVAKQAFRACAKRNLHTKTQVAAGVAESGTNVTTMASEGRLLGLGNSRAVPLRDFPPGEIQPASWITGRRQAFGGLGQPVPISGLVPGEYELAAQMVAMPQAFSVPTKVSPHEHAAQMLALPQARPGAGPRAVLAKARALATGMPLLPQAAPGPDPRAVLAKARALATGTHVSQMLALPQARPGAVPPGAVPLTHVSQMLALPQARANSRAVPLRDFPPGEILPASRMIAQRQAFGLPGLGNGRAVPISALVPGEYVTGHTLVDQVQAFGGLGQPVPISDLAPGEYELASRMIARRQGFGDWIPYTPGEPEPKSGGQGTWLSPSQVPAWDLESAAALVAQPQNFGGLGNVGNSRAVPRKDFVPGEIVPASRMIAQRQAFGGMSDWIPYTPGEPEPTGGTQGTWLSPSQVPAWDLESATALIAQPQSFGGLGNADRAVPRKDFVPGEIESAAEIVSQPQNFGGLGNARAVPLEDFVPDELESAARMISLPQAFGLPGMDSHASQMLSLPQAASSRAVPRKDFVPGEIESAAEIVSQPQNFGGLGQQLAQPDFEAQVQRQVRLPAFYSHPELGPWGVDPRAAYQYWWAQQAAMQRAAVASPLAIWGSPGSVAPTPPLPPSPIAQTAAFDPYNETYPTAGAAVERF